jgi:adenylate cyclase
LWGLWHYYLVNSDFPKAVKLAEQLTGLAHTANDHAFLSDAYRAIGETFLWSGEFSQARAYFEKGIDLTDARQQHSSFAENPGVSCRFFAAIALWFLGYPDQALLRSYEAVTMAQEIAHPFSLSAAHHFASWLHLLRQDSQSAMQHAEAAMTIAADQGFVFFIAFDTMLKGWALAGQGQIKEGISQLHEGLVAFQATGTKVLVPQWMVVLSELYAKSGQVQNAQSVLTEAQRLSEKNNGERYYLAELFRLKGQLLMRGKKDKRLKGSDYDEAVTCFLRAIKWAQQQDAKSLELRAAVSLSRIWQRQGKVSDAFNLLSEIYGWFEEGVDTPDLIAAKGLLEELS